jgi:hypothetical protein
LGRVHPARRWFDKDVGWAVVPGSDNRISANRNVLEQRTIVYRFFYKGLTGNLRHFRQIPGLSVIQF